jgi:cyclophilin family peptidyl-prolyl cis-trans isomerase/HEAT repeat protein
MCTSRWTFERAILITVLVGFGSAGHEVQGRGLPEGDERVLLQAQDTRDATALRDILSGGEPELLIRAAIAAGSLQDTSLIGPLSTLLLHGNDSARSAAAFALGQTGAIMDSAGRRVVAGLLLDRLGRETHEMPLRSVIEALGKTGDAQALLALVGLRSRPVPDDVDGEIALSIGRMAYRGIKNREATAFAVRLMDLMAGPGRWRPAYALMRIGDRTLLDEHASRIAAGAQDTDPDVRMYCASAMAKVNDRRVVLLTLLNLVSVDPDWRVRVNALKSLGGTDPEQAPEATLALIQAADDSNRHIALTAISVLPGMRLVGTEQAAAARSVLAGIVANRNALRLASEQGAAAVALARLFGADAYPDLKPLKGQGRAQQAAYAEALAHVPLEEARNELISLASENDSRVQAASIDALTSSARTAPLMPSTRDRIRNAMKSALRSDDVAVLAAAASGLADSTLADRTSVPELLVTLQRLRVPDQAEAMIAIAEALGRLNDQIAVPSLVALTREPDRLVARAAVTAIEQITGKPHGHLLPKSTRLQEAGVVDWQLLAWVRANRDIVVRTSRGMFSIRLLTDQAPFTCMAIATLVRKTFYDGLTFHRVVPNFVVQGGDPRGDGWGGPGFTIRSEFGMEHYGRGTVGIASSGKDTEGSQFFVTHSRQPHLEGRYTIIGTVTEGIDVVDRLQVGDRIERMRFPSAADTTPGR